MAYIGNQAVAIGARCKKICIIARKQRPPEIAAALRAGDTLSCASPNQRSTTEGGVSCQRWVWFCRVAGRLGPTSTVP